MCSPSPAPRRQHRRPDADSSVVACRRRRGPLSTFRPGPCRATQSTSAVIHTRSSCPHGDHRDRHYPGPQSVRWRHRPGRRSTPPAVVPRRAQAVAGDTRKPWLPSRPSTAIAADEQTLSRPPNTPPTSIRKYARPRRRPLLGRDNRTMPDVAETEVARRPLEERRRERTATIRTRSL